MNFANFYLVKVAHQQVIEISYSGKTYDLHNAAQFNEIQYVVSNRMLKLSWDYYYDEGTVTQIQIEFNDVSFFKIEPRDEEMPEEDDECLEEMVDGEIFEFRFMGGMIILVQAENVSFKTV